MTVQGFKVQRFRVIETVNRRMSKEGISVIFQDGAESVTSRRTANMGSYNNPNDWMSESN